MRAHVAFAALTFATAAWAQTGPSIDGTWELRSTTEKWTFAQSGDVLKVKMTDKSAAATEFECGTLGKDCKVKLGGKNATVSMWYAGPALVQLITQGSNVVKRRFEPAENGETMKFEVTNVVPRDDPKTFELNRLKN